jgi:arginase
VAPFSWLAHRYGDDLAILWIDFHPDIGTPASEYPGFHAMAVAAMTGHGDPDVLRLLPGTVTPDRVAMVGLHEWTEDDIPNVAEWGIRSFGPDLLRESTEPVPAWLAATGCSKVAIHFDVDTIDSNEIVLGLGAVPQGLSSSQERRIVADVAGAGDVVGLTVAAFFPRQVMHLQRVLAGFPLIPACRGPTAEEIAAVPTSLMFEAVPGRGPRRRCNRALHIIERWACIPITCCWPHARPGPRQRSSPSCFGCCSVLSATW